MGGQAIDWQAEDGEMVDVCAHHFADDGRIPNNPKLPMLVYRDVLDLSGDDPAGGCLERFARNGWDRGWRNGIFPYVHFHSTAHEALGICRGWARVRLGGETGIETEVRAGDALILPAGTGHQNLGASGDLLVVGAYPRGPDWDLCRGEPDERPRVLEAIAGVPMPDSDPVFGNDGPLMKVLT